jgi:hypothetical protein
MAEIQETNGYLDVENATLRAPRIEATSNIGIANTNPQHAFSVGSNLYIDTESSDVLTVKGNVVTEGIKMGFLEITPSYDLAAVSNVGNVTQSTIQFSNATTGFVTTANIEVGTANLFVDTTTGRVGIGKTDPGAALDITGPMRLGNELSNIVGLSVVGGDPIMAAAGNYTHAELVHPTPAENDYLGWSVSISADGKYAIVSVHGDDHGGYTGAGSAQVYFWDGYSWGWQAELLHPTPAQDDEFGYSVSISADGTYALVGARYTDPVVADVQYLGAGSAHVFVRDGTSWTHQKELLHPNLVANDNFGWSVSISADGTRALVGARYDEPPSGVSGEGSAHVFVRDGTSWTHQAELLHPDPRQNDWLGYSVSISADGNYAFVGARGDDLFGGFNHGSAHVYFWDGTSWTHQAQLEHPDPQVYDHFGISVSISADGTYALVGAYQDDTVLGGSNAGSAHVFVRDGTSWDHQAELLHPNPAENDYFGWSVAISGDGKYALVGTPYDDPVATNAGSAHVFVRDETSWTYHKEIIGPDPEENGQFGISVSISADGNAFIVGANRDDPVATDAGLAHVYNTPAGLNIDGNMGIGTTNPQRQLHVSGDSWVTGVMYDGYISSNRARSVKKYVNGVNLATLTTTFKLGDIYKGGIIKVYMTSGVSGSSTTATVMYGVWGFNWGGGTTWTTTQMVYYESSSGNNTSIAVASDGVLTISGTMYSSFSYPLMEVEVYYAGGIFVDY